MIGRSLLLFVVITTLLFGDNNKSAEEKEQSFLRNLNQLNLIEKRIKENDFWIKKFYDHKEYNSLKREMNEINLQIDSLRKRRSVKNRIARINELKTTFDTLKSKLSLLETIGKNPYDEVVKFEEKKTLPEIKNPLAILTGYSYISDYKKEKNGYKNRLLTLENSIKLLEQKRDLLENQLELIGKNDVAATFNLQKELSQTEEIIEELKPVKEIFKTTLLVFTKKGSEDIDFLKAEIKQEFIKSGKIVIIIFLVIVLIFFLKLLVRKTIKDDDKIFNFFRIINITAVAFILLILTFNYINNLTYFITVLGFVSAGIAIAMKDWFMNILGWFVIVLGGAIHVGDRIKITKDGEKYVGDVLEITLTRVAFYEDLTLTSYEVNRRTGRVVMFPNNFIFDSIIVNYTFSGLKTVWDGIDVVITFDSNHKKAVSLAKDIIKKFSKGYSDLTKKHISELRGQYHIRNFNPEPRVFTFMKEYGVSISAWYLTNSYATLNLRSTISAEILEAFKQAEDITIALPTQTIMVSSHKEEILNNLNKEIN